MSKPYETLIANPSIAKRREQYLPIVQREAQRVGIDWRYLDALIARESAYKPDAVGDNGRAVGLGQMHPATAKALGLNPKDRTNPELAIRAAAEYFAQGYRKAKGDAGLAGLGYNAGHGAIKPNTTFRGTDDYRGYFEDVQKAITGKGAVASQPAPALKAAADIAQPPQVSALEAAANPEKAISSVLANVPSYTSRLQEIQNVKVPDYDTARESMLFRGAVDDAVDNARAGAVANFFGEEPAPQVQLPEAIESSIDKYLAQLS